MMRIGRLVRLVLLPCLAACGSGVHAVVEPLADAKTTGVVFALTDPGVSVASLTTLAANSQVDGLVIRTSWDTLQPTEATFAWSSIDQAFSVAQSYNKQITLHVLTSAYGKTPSWVYAAGAQSYSYTMGGISHTDPIPWDTVYLSKFSAFLTALHDHLAGAGYLGLLKYTSDGVPVPEMSLVSCTNNQLTSTVAYSRTNYLSAWKMTLNAYFVAFPQVQILVSAPVGVICMPDNDGLTFYTEVMSAAATISKTAFAVYATDLTATGSDRMTQVSAATRQGKSIGFQTIWSSTNDPSSRLKGSLQNAVCQGLAAGGTYFELYQVDILNTGDASIQNAIQTVHSGKC